MRLLNGKKLLSQVMRSAWERVCPRLLLGSRPQRSGQRLQEVVHALVLDELSTGKLRATCKAGPRRPSTSRKARGPSFRTSSSLIAFSRACLILTLKLYSERREASPSNRGTPAFPSVDVCSSMASLKVDQRRASHRRIWSDYAREVLRGLP